MRILITNDDGIHAPGLQTLYNIARELSDDVWVLAPETDQSGVSHAITISDPIRLRKIDNKRYAVRGTPTDCVVMAMRHVMLDCPPDLVLSGVNRGQNAAYDVTYSGTVAGAMEGMIMGVRSIALSMRIGSDAPPQWPTVQRYGAEVLREVLKKPYDEGVLININFPHCPPDQVMGVQVCNQGSRGLDTVLVEERHDGRQNPYFWIKFKRGLEDYEEGSDMHALTNNYITVTPLHLDLTHHKSLVTYSDISKKY
jgi:5'-nucleotidase